MLPRPVLHNCIMVTSAVSTGQCRYIHNESNTATCTQGDAETRQGHTKDTGRCGDGASADGPHNSPLFGRLQRCVGVRVRIGTAMAMVVVVVRKPNVHADDACACITCVDSGVNSGVRAQRSGSQNRHCHQQ